MGNKYCPIMSAGAAANQEILKYQKEPGIFCKKEECALWVNSDGHCAFKAIAEKLFYLQWKN